MAQYEYGLLAKHYDELYSRKDYQKETAFLTNILSKYNVKTILDAGCGTGSHMRLLEQNNYTCTGLDISNDMLLIAKNKVNGPLHQGNITDFNLYNKYDAIISMYAVFNHLLAKENIIESLKTFTNHLNPNGIIIVDLHNPSSSGNKEDTINGIGRKMIWNYDPINKVEQTSIIYTIDNNSFEDNHTFKIYSIDEIKEYAEYVNLTFIAAYENYDINKLANDKSKNIQILLQKSI